MELFNYAADSFSGLVIVIVGIILFMIYKFFGGIKWSLILISVFTAFVLFNNYPEFTIILGSTIVVFTIISRFIPKCANCGSTMSDKNTNKCLNCNIDWTEKTL